MSTCGVYITEHNPKTDKCKGLVNEGARKGLEKTFKVEQPELDPEYAPSASSAAQPSSAAASALQLLLAAASAPLEPSTAMIAAVPEAPQAPGSKVSAMFSDMLGKESDSLEL